MRQTERERVRQTERERERERVRHTQRERETEREVEIKNRESFKRHFGLYFHTFLKQCFFFPMTVSVPLFIWKPQVSCLHSFHGCSPHHVLNILCSHKLTRLMNKLESSQARRRRRRRKKKKKKRKLFP
mgnify:CR=1 FL=1